MTQAVPHPCQAGGCPNLKLPGRGSRYCQEHRDATEYKQNLEIKPCHMPGCEEPKLFGRSYRYCTRHSEEGPARERAQIVRRAREREYGITHEEFLAMLEAQGGVCAICGNGNDDERQLSVDHDHVTGAVRALLCHRCNPMLGYARDSIAVLQAAIEYLKKNGQVLSPPVAEL